jgi:hypothetical protein
MQLPLRFKQLYKKKPLQAPAYTSAPDQAQWSIVKTHNMNLGDTVFEFRLEKTCYRGVDDFTHPYANARILVYNISRLPHSSNPELPITAWIRVLSSAGSRSPGQDA